jgi:hypothetical protein
MKCNTFKYNVYKVKKINISWSLILTKFIYITLFMLFHFLMHDIMISKINLKTVAYILQLNLKEKKTIE